MPELPNVWAESRVESRTRVGSHIDAKERWIAGDRGVVFPAGTWVDSSLYLRKRREQLLLAVEHRAAAAIDPVAIELVGDEGELHLELVGGEEQADEADDLADALLAALDERPRTRTDLRAHLRVRNERLGITLAQLRDAGRILQRDGLWTVVPRSAS